MNERRRAIRARVGERLARNASAGSESTGCRACGPPQSAPAGSRACRSQSPRLPKAWAREVGDKIADREICLVADGRNHRNREAATARATASSLNVHRSSSEPAAARHNHHLRPSVSLKYAIPCADLRHRSLALHLRRVIAECAGPESGVRARAKCRESRRRRAMSRCQCDAAIAGSGRLRAGSKSPSAESFRFNCSKASCSAPAPCGSSASTIS